jgi:hypothetical protein
MSRKVDECKPLTAGRDGCGGHHHHDELRRRARVLSNRRRRRRRRRRQRNDVGGRRGVRCPGRSPGARRGSARGPVAARLGKAAQVDPINPQLKAPGSKRCKLKYNKLRSTFAFNFNMRCYALAYDAHAGAAGAAGAAYNRSAVNGSAVNGSGAGDDIASAPRAAGTTSLVLRGTGGAELNVTSLTAWGLLRTSTRPTLNLLPFLRASVSAIQLNVSHAPISVRTST